MEDCPHTCGRSCVCMCRLAVGRAFGSDASAGRRPGAGGAGCCSAAISVNSATAVVGNSNLLGGSFYSSCSNE